MDYIWWIALFITLIGIILVAYNPNNRDTRAILRGIFWSFLSAVIFSLIDISIQYKSHYDAILLPIMYTLPGIMSSLLFFNIFIINRKKNHQQYLFTKIATQHQKRLAYLLLIIANISFSVQTLILYIDINLFHNAILANLLYGIRGVWTMLLFAFSLLIFDKYNRRREIQIDSKIVFYRILGSVLILLIAIVLIFDDI